MPFLQKAGHSYQDFGCYSTKPVDYPDIAQKVGKAVASGNFDQGILICSTGIGMCIAANKIKGVRAALCHNSFTAQRCQRFVPRGREYGYQASFGNRQNFLGHGF